MLTIAVGFELETASTLLVRQFAHFSHAGTASRCRIVFRLDVAPFKRIDPPLVSGR
jgi:hypothetical protein